MRGPGHKRNTRVCIGRCDTEQARRRAGPRATFTLPRVGAPARAAVHGRTMTRLGVRVLCGVLCGLQPSSSRYGVRVSDAVGGPTWSPGQVQRPSPAAPRSRPRKARRRAGTARRGRCLPATSQPPHIRPPPANSGALAGTQPSRRRRSPFALRTSRTMEPLRERSGPASGCGVGLGVARCKEQ